MLSEPLGSESPVDPAIMLSVGMGNVPKIFDHTFIYSNKKSVKQNING